MKLTLKIHNDGWGEITHALGVNGELYTTIYSLSECPEDAVIGRSLFDGKKIIAAIRLGYEAGLRCEHFGVEEIKVDDIDGLEFGEVEDRAIEHDRSEEVA